MARLKKEVVIAKLIELGVSVEPNAKYNDLCKLLKAKTVPDNEQTKPEEEEQPKQIRIVNKIRKHNTFVGDAVRNDRDTTFLNHEIRQIKYKGKIKRITTIKECDVSDDGYWVTEFIIDLK